MSADAKLWQDDVGDGWTSWRAAHDGPCVSPESHLRSLTLPAAIAEVEKCMGHELRWELWFYADGHMGLKGWLA
jgi:hypothetical protein